LALRTRGVSPVTLIPQDKEGFGSDISHEENVNFIFEESRTLLSNQLVNYVFEKSSKLKATIFFKTVFRKEPLKKYRFDALSNR
jgi:hypothetical protein